MYVVSCATVLYDQQPLESLKQKSGLYFAQTSFESTWRRGAWRSGCVHAFYTYMYMYAWRAHSTKRERIVSCLVECTGWCRGLEQHTDSFVVLSQLLERQFNQLYVKCILIRLLKHSSTSLILGHPFSFLTEYNLVVWAAKLSWFLTIQLWLIRISGISVNFPGYFPAPSRVRACSLLTTNTIVIRQNLWPSVQPRSVQKLQRTPYLQDLVIK